MRFVRLLRACAFMGLVLSVLPLAAPAQTDLAQSAALQRYLEEKILPWSQSHVLIEALHAQNDRFAGIDQAEIDRLDAAWRGEIDQQTRPTVDGVLNTSASAFLRGILYSSGHEVGEIFVMDAHGLNVASSGLTSDYWQGDEAKFQQTFGLGPGAVHVSEVERDESMQIYAVQVSVTVTDPDTGDAIGAMTVGLDAEIFF